MTPEQLQAIKERNQGDADMMLLIAEIESLRSRIVYLEGWKEGAQTSRIPHNPEKEPPFITRNEF